jgi:hypothetical protein
MSDDRKNDESTKNTTVAPTISTGDLKEEVEKLLKSGSLFEVSEVKERGAAFEHLGQLTMEFFARYPHVRSRSGGTVIGLDLVFPSTYADGYISIGHVEDWDVVIKRGEDRIFVIEGAESTPEETDDQYVDIFDFIYREALSTDATS